MYISVWFIAVQLNPKYFEGPENGFTNVIFNTD